MYVPLRANVVGANCSRRFCYVGDKKRVVNAETSADTEVNTVQVLHVCVCVVHVREHALTCPGVQPATLRAR